MCLLELLVGSLPALGTGFFFSPSTNPLDRWKSPQKESFPTGSGHIPVLALGQSCGTLVKWFNSLSPDFSPQA